MGILARLWRVRQRVGPILPRVGRWINVAVNSTPDARDDTAPWWIAAFRKAWGGLIGGLVGAALLWLGGKLGVDLIQYQDAIVDFSWTSVVVPFFSALGTYLVGPNKPRNT